MSLYTNVEKTSERSESRHDTNPRFIVRDFTWEDSALEKQKREITELEAEEKELWASIEQRYRASYRMLTFRLISSN